MHSYVCTPMQHGQLYGRSEAHAKTRFDFKRMIDLHTHLLHGIDDGPETIAESLELAAAMAADGVTIAACTPHNVRDDYGTTPERMEAALAGLQRELDAAQIPLEVRGGGEIALDELGALDEDTRRRFGLGGNPRLLLLEFPYFGWPLALLVRRHRSGDEWNRPGARPPGTELRRARGAREPPASGRIRRVCAADGGLARRQRGFGGCSLRENVARSRPGALARADSHGAAIPRAGLGSGRRAIDSAELATWLTDSVPRALLAGRDATAETCPASAAVATWLTEGAELSSPASARAPGPLGSKGGVVNDFAVRSGWPTRSCQRTLRRRNFAWTGWYL